MTELSSRALLLLRIYARSAQQSRKTGHFFMHPDNDTLGPLEKELVDAGLVEKVTKAITSLHIIGKITDKGKAFCKLAGYPE